jgi:hypothetical protein
MSMDYCILPEYLDLGLGLILFFEYINNLIKMGYKVSVGVIFNEKMKQRKFFGAKFIYHKDME